MGLFFGLAVGYYLGARTGGKDLDQLTRSLKSLADTDEFADVVTAARSHLGHTLREIASMVDRDGVAGSDDPSLDLVDRVRKIVDRS